MRTLARWLLALVPAAVLGATVWYVWPRSDLAPEPGTVITAPIPRLLWVPLGVLILHWAVYLTVLMARERRTMERNRASLVLGAVSLLLIAVGVVLLAFGPASALLPLLPASWLTIAFLVVSRAKKRLWTYLGALGPVAVMASPLLLGLWLFACHPWMDAAQLELSEGRTLHVQRYWESDVLTEELDRGWLFLRTRVIAGTYGEYFNVALVRPSAPGYDFPRPAQDHALWKTHGRLVQSTDGRFVAFIYQYAAYASNKVGCATNLAYDLATGERWSAERDFERLVSLSPFILVGKYDRINTEDVEAMMAPRDQWVATCEDPATIASLRTHPNPWVRVAASSWQRTLSKDAHTLRRELTHEAEHGDDRRQRIAAREALAWLDELAGE